MSLNGKPSRWTESFDEEFDIVVVGYGYSGAISAIEAARTGAKVLLIEKTAVPGGISICSYGAVRAAHDKQKAFQYLKQTNGNRTPDDVVRALADGMTEMEPYVRDLAKANGSEIETTEEYGKNGANYPMPGYDTFYHTTVKWVPNFDARAVYPWANGAPGGPMLFKIIEDNMVQVPIADDLAHGMKRRYVPESDLRLLSAWPIRKLASAKPLIIDCGGLEFLTLVDFAFLGRAKLMRVATIIAWGVLSFLLSFAPALAEKRVALVIGNSAYQNVSKLTNPTNDAKAIAGMLQYAGLDAVELYENLGIRELRRAIGEFSDMARDADMAIVYYSGHGMEVDGVNYLIPIDAVLDRDVDVPYESFSLDNLLKVLEPVKRLRLVMLDACRDNPFVRSMKRTTATRAVGRGLAAVEPTSVNTLIGFAAKAGSTASDGDGVNSPYAIALLNHIATPGVDLRIGFGRVRDDVMKSTKNKQEPFVYGSLGGANISIVDAPAAADAGTMPRTQTPTYSLDRAAQVWAATKDTTSIAILEDFIRQFGSTPYGSMARARLDELKKNQVAVGNPKSPATAATREVDIFTAEASIATENELLLDPQARRDIQNRLNLIGFPTQIDSVFGDLTRGAIARWQTAHGYPKSGYLNKLQHLALLKESASASTRANTNTRSIEQNPSSKPRQVENPSQQQAENPSGNSSNNPVTGATDFVGGVVNGVLQGIGKVLGGNNAPPASGDASAPR